MLDVLLAKVHYDMLQCFIISCVILHALARPMQFPILTKRGATEDKNPILMNKTYARNYENLELDHIILFTSSNTLLYTGSH